METVIVEEPFALLPPDSDKSQQSVPQSSGNLDPKDVLAPDTSNKTGDGCYVSATIQNKRFYGVLIDQASLKAAR